MLRRAWSAVSPDPLLARPIVPEANDAVAVACAGAIASAGQVDARRCGGAAGTQQRNTPHSRQHNRRSTVSNSTGCVYAGRGRKRKERRKRRRGGEATATSLATALQQKVLLRRGSVRVRLLLWVSLADKVVAWVARRPVIPVVVVVVADARRGRAAYHQHPPGESARGTAGPAGVGRKRTGIGADGALRAFPQLKVDRCSVCSQTPAVSARFAHACVRRSESLLPVHSHCIPGPELLRPMTQLPWSASTLGAGEVLQMTAVHPR